MFLTSKAFTNGGRIPKKHTQEAQGAVKDVSPPLEWHNVPEDAVTLALVMEDPAPTESHAVDHWTHWVVCNIPPTLKGLPEGFATKDVDSEDDDLGEIREGVNDFKGHGYHGPNPPSGEHTFEFHLYALDAKLKLPKKPSRDRLMDAMDGHILAEAVLVGHYHKENFQTGRDSYVGPGDAHMSNVGHGTGKGGGRQHGR